jgi:hypothetical protein
VQLGHFPRRLLSSLAPKRRGGNALGNAGCPSVRQAVLTFRDGSTAADP